jgi:hypothetical protein
MTSSTNNSFDVLVVGGDAAALVAALDCARIGLRVAVFATPASAHSPSIFSHRGGIVASLLAELEIEHVVHASRSGAGDDSGATTDVMHSSIVGIPANPFALQVRQTLGWRGVWRVYSDRVMPLLTIGTEANLAKIVRRRLGKRAVTRLVDPALQELYGRTAAEVSVAAVVPGLNQAMTRAGSLTTGIIELIVGDPRLAQTVEVAGGTEHIETVLRARLEFFSARIIDVTDVRLTVVAPSGDLPASFGARAFGRRAASGAHGDGAPEANESLAHESPAEEIALVAHAILLNPEHATIPGDCPDGLAGEVGVTRQYPGLESAVPESRAASAAIRRVLLSNPKRLPLGPLGLEG